MEFAMVTFPEVRGVQMDGAPQGLTGQVIGVQRGHHDFDLGDPQNYVPPTIHALVAGTTQMQPMVIAFALAPAGVPAPATLGMGAPLRAAKPPKKARRKAKGKKAGKAPAKTKKTKRPVAKKGTARSRKAGRSPKRK